MIDRVGEVKDETDFISGQGNSKRRKVANNSTLQASVENLSS